MAERVSVISQQPPLRNENSVSFRAQCADVCVTVGDTVKNIYEAIQMGLVTQSPERMTNASEVGATRLDKQQGQGDRLKEQGIGKPRCDNLMRHPGGDARQVFKRKAGMKGLQILETATPCCGFNLQ